MSTTFGIRIDNHFVSVARRSNGEISIINPLILLIPKHIKLENDNSAQGIDTVGDLNQALSKQHIDKKPTDISREDVLTNELDKLC